jgi:hypothetical protein
MRSRLWIVMAFALGLVVVAFFLGDAPALQYGMWAFAVVVLILAGTLINAGGPAPPKG